MKRHLISLLAMTNFCVAAEEKQATITNGVKEGQLATVTLTQKAEQRLGIVAVPVERRKVSQSRLLGGELILPADVPNQSGEQSIFTILPQMTPSERLRVAEAQIDADGEVEVARVQLEAVEVEVTRAEVLLRDKAGSAKALDQAKAQRALAQAAQDAAKAKRALLGSQVLPALSPEILWVKVPVYVGELKRLALDQDAVLTGLDGRPDATPVMLKPIKAPPSANAATSTVDLFYQFNNPEGKHLPGERVAILAPLTTEEESLVVPWASVLYDFNGGAWVYEQLGNQSYTRRRVDVHHVAGKDAILTRGPEPGTKVVTLGAPEIFGTEFGTGK
jgi:hypothetical protein